MDKIKHVFFDLDRTLWDFEKTALQAFDKIYIKYNLNEYGIPSGKTFHDSYSVHNDKLWDQYRKGEIKKDVLRGLRFKLTINEFGVYDDELAEQIGNEYVRISPLIVNLFPNAIEVLDYLYPKYKLHIITNGFAEVQAVKLSESGMIKYFDKVITSEEAGVKKPDPQIFLHAFTESGAKPSESIMIGDDFEVDILGAMNVGAKQIFFDPNFIKKSNACDYTIRNLKEIMDIL